MNEKVAIVFIIFMVLTPVTILAYFGIGYVKGVAATRRSAERVGRGRDLELQ
jgi:hypothetical protein